MARAIKLSTKLRRGDIIRVSDKVIGVVVQHEKFLDVPGYYALNKTPGDRKFINENGVDWYSRHHIYDLVRDKAEVITRKELLEMFNKNPGDDVLKTMVELTKPKRRKKKK